MATARRGGGITRRCECRGPDKKRLGAKCPKLKQRKHGRYEIHQELPDDAEGKRRRFRRTGYDEKSDAEADLEKVRALLAVAADDDEGEQRRVGDLLAGLMPKRLPIPEPDQVRRQLGIGAPLGTVRTMAELLDAWLDAKTRSRRQTTVAGYVSHVRTHLRPGIGHLRTDRFSVVQAQAFFDDMADRADVIRAENEQRRAQVERTRWRKPGRPPAPERARLAKERERLAELPPYRKVPDLPSRHAVRRSLRAALNWGIARPEYGLTMNVASHVDLTPYRRPKGLLWTEARVKRWRETGEIPSRVMVWTPAQLGQFLDAAESHRLYAAWHTIAHHGLRRGEAVGSQWAHLDEKARVLHVVREITVADGAEHETDPKTAESAAPVYLDRGTVAVLQRHRLHQLGERDEWNAHAAEARERGEGVADWTDSGFILTSPDGTPIHPDELSAEFRKVVAEERLPPINLRDLRHLAAALVKAAGGDLEDAKVKLRHSTITLTSDTYMTLFQEAEEELAESMAAVVSAARRKPVAVAEE